MPFAGYKDFDECVAKNRDKSDPKAYCATIERKVKEGMEPIQVHELIDAQEATFHKDEETGKMTGRVVIIKAGRAKNPRKYRASALQKAAKEGVYDGLRMFVNHSEKPPIRRDFGEMVSAVESTEWDPKRQAIVGNIEFFDENFFNQAQRAKKYIGVSADHRIRVNYVQEGQQRIEDVTEIAFARSVDWVLYPSAGGEILSFARESEGADQVEWSEVTLEQLKENAPQLIEQLKAEFVPATESTETPEPQVPEPTLTAADVAKMVQEQVQQVLATTEQNATKRTETSKKVRELVSKSGLPNRTQARIINAFEGQLEFDENAVKATITDAKEELKEAGAGPKITGMGPSTSSGTSEEKKNITVRESVESYFGSPATN